MIKHLYDDLASRWYAKKGTIYVISDPHFGDLDCYILRKVYNIKIEDGKKYYQTGDNIWEDEDSLRCSMKEFDDFQVKTINSKCSKNDTLIILGDVGDVSYIKRLKAGYKVLIMGNHDKGASNYKRNSFVKTFYKHNYKTFDDMLEEAKSYGVLESLTYADWLNTSPEDDTYLAYYDNHLFDEVYEGPLMINDRVILSHEPIFSGVNYFFNIHGHVHNTNYKGDGHHLNVCAEVINYTPINLINFIKSGNISHIENIHRLTIDVAIKRKKVKKVVDK